MAMGVANVLGYLMVALLTRALGPEDFGGYTALSTYGVVLAIPAGALQIVIARRVTAPDAATEEVTSGLRTAATIGLGIFVFTALLAPVLRTLFHLDSAWSPVLLGGVLPAMLVTGCVQGVLLGQHRLRSLALLYLVTAGTRLLVAIAATVFDFSVLQVMAGMLIAAVVTAAFGVWTIRAQLRTLPASGRGLVTELVRSNMTLAAFVALTNVDVLLARHYLTPHESGGYSLASTFGRAICWGTQFVALILVPRMRQRNATVTLLKASGVVLALGLLAAAVVAVSPRTVIVIAGGPEYAEYGRLALVCVGLGITWALAQLWLFSEMGSNTTVLGLTTWVVIVLEVAAIALRWHQSAAQIVAVCVVGALVVAALGLVRVVRRHQNADLEAEASVMAVADRA
ncbi:oligosaccharide flippase family protein [Calidifontibacter sp. DB2511S]|nr:oligosaccharide flippase family protein [Calidifontibacter sp. DB2511S]